MLTINDISARIAGRLLIDHATVALPAGAKVGLVGRNGAGKSTLFRIITGEMATETGSISIPKNTRIGQVAQEAPSEDTPLVEIVLRADLERSALMAEAETAKNPLRIADIQTRLADIDAHSAEARAASILAGLGFDTEAQQRPASSFSGGWRMRVALASVLFAAPDLLLLDEPTNYLDLEGTLWLEEFIKRYQYTVLIISHDRDLLNTAANMIIHLDQKKLTPYRGNFDQFERQKSERDMLQMKAREKNLAKRKHMEAFVERFRAKASKAKQAQSRLKALQKLGTVDAIIEGSVTGFSFPAPARQAASPIVAIKDGAVGYTPNKPVLKNLDLRIDTDDRIALLGSNGNGKSTFAKLIAGRLSAEVGDVKLAPQLKIGFFAQHQLDDLRPNESAVAHVRSLMPDVAEGRVRARVAQMGLTTDKMDTPAKDLSGGEKARLLMGLAVFDNPDLVILDEPTNHLDIDSRAALISALNDFPGAVILISHDRHLIEATVDRLWIVRDGTVEDFDGDLDEYRQEVVSGSKTKTKGSGGDGVSKAEQRRENAGAAVTHALLKKKINDLEQLMEKLANQIQGLDKELADPELQGKNEWKATQLFKKRAQKAQERETAEENWLTALAEYEDLVAGENQGA